MTFHSAEGPSTINREWGKRRIIVQANVQGRDVGSFVEDAQRRIARSILPTLPKGYTIAWGGQFENKIRAEKRLWLVVPLALVLTLSLLYLTFGSLRDALMIFSGVLFARVVRRVRAMGDGAAVHDLGRGGVRGAGGRVDAGGAGAREREFATGWRTA